MILACTKLSLAYFLNQISSFEEDSIAFLATLLTIIGTVHWAPLSVARSALEGILPDGSPVFMGDPCGPCFTNFVDVVVCRLRVKASKSDADYIIGYL